MAFKEIPKEAKRTKKIYIIPMIHSTQVNAEELIKKLRKIVESENGKVEIAYEVPNDRYWIAFLTSIRNLDEDRFPRSKTSPAFAFTMFREFKELNKNGILIHPIDVESEKLAIMINLMPYSKEQSTRDMSLYLRVKMFCEEMAVLEASNKIREEEMASNVKTILNCSLLPVIVLIGNAHVKGVKARFEGEETEVKVVETSQNENGTVNDKFLELVNGAKEAAKKKEKSDGDIIAMAKIIILDFLTGGTLETGDLNILFEKVEKIGSVNEAEQVYEEVQRRYFADSLRSLERR